MPSPAEMEVALYYYYTHEGIFPKTHPAYKEAFEYLVNIGLLEKISNTFKKTDGLDVYVDTLKQIPFPKKEIVSTEKWAIDIPKSLSSLAAKAIGSQGGKARAEKLSPKRRTAIAKKAANARWGKKD